MYSTKTHGNFFVNFFSVFLFFHILTALLTLAQAQTNPFGVLTIFSESLIIPYETVTTHSKTLSTPS